jgi:integrase
MARNPREEYQTARESLDKAVESGGVAEEDAEAIRRLCYAFDAEDARESLPTDIYERRSTSHKEYRTLGSWCERLTEAAKNLTLTDTDADTINTYTTSLVKDDEGPGKAHIRNIEYALSKFYRFHDDLGVEPSEITVHEYKSNGSNGWDERDLLTADERAALRAVATHPRDKAIFHLALYCGLRNTGLRTLRVKDIQLQDHEWYFNTTADGLKHIDRPDEPRPLFQAERTVRDWLEMHPDPQPDNYLITAKQSASKKDPSKPMTRETIRYTMQQLKDRTAERDDVMTVKKPCHPHMMRHNFVSMCRKHPDITDADIKFYIGHDPSSDVMETTYSHLSSDEHNSAGHSAFGVVDAGDNDDDIPPWDSTCKRCDRVLAPGEDECEECGTPRGTTPWDDLAMAEEAGKDDFRQLIRDTVQEEFEKQLQTKEVKQIREALGEESGIDSGPNSLEELAEKADTED